MRKQTKIAWICLLVFTMVFSPISAMFITYADESGNDVTDTVASNFISGVDLKEIVGVMPGDSLIGEEDLEKTTDFFLYYDFDIPNTFDVEEGDYIVLNIPPAIVLPAILEGSPLELWTTDGDLIANAHTVAGNKIKIVFTSTAATLSNVGGAFFIAGGFDEHEINTDGSDTIIDFGPTGGTIELKFKADPLPELQPVALRKNGQIHSGTDIEWTITIDNELVNAATHYVDDVFNPVLVDVIPTNQSLDVDSITVNGIPVDPTDVSYEGNTLRLTLADIASDSRVDISIVTQLTAEALEEALSSGETSINVTNTATLEHDDGLTTTVDSPKTVTIPLNILSKSGQRLDNTTANNTKNIKWTIVVNEDKLEFNDAVIKDTLPTGLSFIVGSEAIVDENGDSVSGVILNVVDQVVTFQLGNINEKIVITYETEIDPAKFKNNTWTDFRNQAVLTWDGLAPGVGVTRGGSVGVGSSLFTKSGAGYNRANGVISWKIDINNENIHLDAPMITDTIPAEHKYIEGSARIVDHLGNAYAGGNFSYDPATSTLSYTFGSNINSKYTITFDTKPVSTELITANRSGSFTNTANFKSGTIDIDETASQSFSSNVFRKSNAGYNKNNRHITWRLTVNENGATTPSSNSAAVDPDLYDPIPLNNVIITDTIPEGLQYAGNFTIRDHNNVDASGIAAVNEADGVLTITFNQAITKQYTITFDTEIIDEAKFTSKDNHNNGNFNITNSATLKHDETTINNTDSATQEIKNHIVSKKGAAPAYGDEHIDWAVYINSNAVNLNAVLDVDKFWLIDYLQPGLMLDTTSVVLTRYSEAIEVPNTIPNGGNDGLGAGINVPIDGENIEYDATTGEFRFNFPNDPITDAYKLSFRTYLEDHVAPGTNFSNSINLYGSKAGVPVSIENAYESNEAHTVNFTLMGSMAYGNLGKIIVHKIDSEDASEKLTATFALYDQYGNKVQEKTTVNGELEFSRVKIGRPYFVKEVEAPTGYLLSAQVRKDGTPATLTTTADEVEDAVKVEVQFTATPVELVFANEKIKANIEFQKQDENNAPLAGAKFGLYLRGAPVESVPLAESTSDALGVVQFANIPYGQYDIYEITAPNGYVKLTGVVHAVEVTSDDHGKTLTYVPVANELIKTTLSFYKKDESNNGLANAEFTLFDLNGDAVVTENSDAAGKVVSDATGLVEFRGVLAGTYKILETGTPYGYVPESRYVQTLTGQEEIVVTEANHGNTIILEDVTNVLIQANIQLNKLDDNSQPLANATFGLYNSADALIQSQVSELDGTVTFENVGQGLYTVKEISAPTGYIASTTEQAVSITSGDHGKTISLDDVVNTRIRADIAFTKQFEMKGSASSKLPIAEFGLFIAGDTPATAAPLFTASNDEDTGVVSFENVPSGQYDIYELTVPFGYRTLNGIVHTVSITHDSANHNKLYELAPVANELIKADITFKKIIEGTLKGLAGAEFTLYNNSDDSVVAREVSDDTGTVTFKDVLEGDYKIRETAAPFGYVPRLGSIGMEFIEVTEAEHGTTITLADISNVLIQANIEFVKHDENNQPLSGATFGLYDSTDTLVQIQPSGADGVVSFTNIGEGSYTIQEISPRYGYVPIEGVIYNVVIDASHHTETIQLAPVSNTLIEADIEFIKVNEKGDALAGAVFNLLDELDAIVQTVTSDDAGKVRFVKVGEGEYTIREHTPPVGYNPLPTDVATVIVDAAKHNTTITLPNATNQIIRGDIELVKVNSTGKPLRNAHFALHAADDTKFDNELARATSDENGIVRFSNVEYGDYSIIEIVAPAGYYRSKEELSVSIREEGKLYSLGNFENKKIPNDDVEGTIEIKKENIFGEPLSGATFALYNDMGSLVSEAISNRSGIARFSLVGKGVYTVKELEAPEHYEKSEQAHEITISYSQSYERLTIVNERSSDAPWPTVSVQKVDEAGAPLAGVKFGLFKATDTSFSTPITNSSTDASGVAAFINIPEGDYVVKELEALEGYVLSEITLPVTVTEVAKTFSAGIMENRIIRGDIIVTKVNEEDEPLQGAKFGLYDANDKVIAVATSNSEGIVSFNNIPYGFYKLKEVTAPEFYKKSDDVIAIHVTEDGEVQTLTLVNKVDDSPDDESVIVASTEDNKKSDEAGSALGSGNNENDDHSFDTGLVTDEQKQNDVSKNSDVTDVALPGNQLPKTGDSISTMIWLFIASGLFIASYALIGRKRVRKQ